MPLRVAVTGGAGYVAGRLIRWLEQSEDIEFVLATDIRPPPAKFGEKVEFVTQDITEPFPDLFGDHDVDAVVHLAYVLNPGHRASAARKVNVVGTENVLDACSNSGVHHLIYLSSTSVYGAHLDNPEFLTEGDPVRPIKGFQYSEDKAEAESKLESFARLNSSVAVTILRGCPVMGPNADNFIANAFRKPVLPQVGTADPEMQFLHEDDLIDVLMQCLEQRPEGTFNVAGDGTIRWSEMAAAMDCRMVRLPAPVWYALTSIGWHIRIQSDSPACGLDFVRYRWTAGADRLKDALRIKLRYTSRQAWESYVRASYRAKEASERGA